jgi:hypothetical protein
LSPAFRSYLEWLGGGVLDHFYYGLLFSVPIFALLALNRRTDLRAAALFALSLPGAIGGVALLLFTATSETAIRSALATAAYFPAFWIMPIVAAVQTRKLRGPKRPLTLAGAIWSGLTAALITGLYFLTADANQVDWS